jgi:hypothetical protein
LYEQSFGKSKQMFEVHTNKFLHIFFIAWLVCVVGARCLAAAAPTAAAWVGVTGPPVIAPDAAFRVSARIANAGGSIWEARGPGRVVIAAMIVDANGNPWPQAEVRSEIAYPVPAGSATTADIALRAPSAPGRYVALLGRGVMEKGAMRLDTAEPARWAFEVRK